MSLALDIDIPLAGPPPGAFNRVGAGSGLDTVPRRARGRLRECLAD